MLLSKLRYKVGSTEKFALKYGALQKIMQDSLKVHFNGLNEMVLMDLKAHENIFPLETLFNFTLIYLFPNSYMSSNACTFQICTELVWSLMITLTHGHLSLHASS